MVPYGKPPGSHRKRHDPSKEKVMIMAKPLEIVVVDDEEQITDLLTMAIQFTSKTARVHAFNDSAVAREYLLTHPVDVVITDYKMPQYDGIDLLNVAPRETKKVLISGYVSEIAEEKLSEMNAVFFEKPVPIKTLGKLIAEQEMKDAEHPA
ncbi:MAG: response regulator [Chitinivibrionales bacterium]|nr:response regulator [Chitinivibrionales bacterium]